MNLNFSIKQWVKSTVRKVVKKAAETVAATISEWQLRGDFAAALKSLRPWPEAKATMIATLRARRDAVRR